MEILLILLILYYLIVTIFFVLHNSYIFMKFLYKIFETTAITCTRITNYFYNKMQDQTHDEYVFTRDDFSESTTESSTHTIELNTD